MIKCDTARWFPLVLGQLRTLQPVPTGEFPSSINHGMIVSVDMAYLYHF
jgi:hypothetical protein